MSVRYSTEWRHARIQKKVINYDHGDGHKIPCAWDTCENDGLELYKVVTHLGKNRGERTMNYVFCSERHKMYWVNSVRDLGNLPSGYKQSIM